MVDDEQCPTSDPREQDEYGSRACGTLDEIAGTLHFTGGYPIAAEAREAAVFVRDAAARIAALEAENARLKAEGEDAYESGVREGIKLVEQQTKRVYRPGPNDVEAEVAVGWIEWACSIARDEAAERGERKGK